MLQDAESKNIIRTVKELFFKALESGDSLGKLIDVYFIPQEIEKKQNAEVSTPWKLRQEMLNQLPDEFWKSPKKVFEPCAGKGGFLMDILEKFMNGLKDFISDEQERKQFILEHCIYWADINPVNIFICNLLLNPKEVLKLNFYEGDTLKLNLQKQWGLENFDAVIGNSPYNSSGNTATGNTIWQEFTKKALEKWISPLGFLCFVHPPGWRKPCYKKSQLKGLFSKMVQENHMMYLEIHGLMDGKKTFNCGTRYDWYLIKTASNGTTLVKDENGIGMELEWNWI